MGIDEAGYGPILGPLVVSATAFDVRAEAAGECLWTTLNASVKSTACAGDTRIPVLDSKVLFRRKQGLRPLERSVLAVLGAWRPLPPTLDGLLKQLCPDVVGQLREYAWYAASDRPLPIRADLGGIRIAAARLERDMRDRSVQIAGLWSEVLLEGHYNRLVGSTDNKAVVLLGLTLRLIQRVADAFPDRELRVFVDKQGARDHYQRPLMRCFEGRRLRVIAEGRDHSAYELTHDAQRPWRISFHQSGESHHFTVALASMFSKYIREALMQCFNDFWTERAPGVKPTAGYYLDGLRFLRDIEPHIRQLGVARERLVRSR